MSKQPGRKARGLSKDEHDLWDVVTRSVAPLKARKARARPEADTGPLPEVTGPGRPPPPGPAPPPPAPPPRRVPPRPKLPPIRRRRRVRSSAGSKAASRAGRKRSTPVSICTA